MFCRWDSFGVSVSVLSSRVIWLFWQVQASNDASLLCYKLFLLCSYSTSFFFIQSIIVARCLPRVSSLPFRLLRLYAEGIHFSTHDVTNFSVFVGWCSSSFFVHPTCPKPLDWIGVQSNWFSLTFFKSTFKMIPIVECPPSSTSIFLRHKLRRSSRW